MDQDKDKMDEHVGKMETQLKHWGAKLDELKAKAEAAGTDAKADLQKRFTELKAKHQQAHTKLSEIKAAGHEKWGTLKAGAEHVWHDVDEAFKKLKG
jgi:predicted  nucleic acid-binding Zn-ribbon protein